MCLRVCACVHVGGVHVDSRDAESVELFPLLGGCEGRGPVFVEEVQKVP